MTDEEFCAIESAITGEHIDKVGQLINVRFTGRELKEYLEQAILLYNKNNPQPTFYCMEEEDLEEKIMRCKKQCINCAEKEEKDT